MKNGITTIGLYLLVFPFLYLITDFIQGKDLNWLTYIKFDIGIIIGGATGVILMWLIGKLKLNIIVSIVLGLVLFGVILGLLMRSGILDFLK